MTSQSNAPTAEQPAGLSTATCWFLFVATLTGATLFILGVFDLATVWELPRGMSGFLAATTATAGIGAIVRIAADGVNRRLDRQHDELSEQVATFGEQRYQAGHDDGFVDGAAGPSPQVPSLNGRRPRPVTHG